MENCLNHNILEVGCDEAGRGSLVGPVFAAAVILPKDFEHPLLDDSKKMKPKDRDLLRLIIEKESLAYAVASIAAKEIDKINILNASIKAMHKAIDMLNLTPEHILVDGNRFKKYKDIPYTCIVKGDGKYANIAAASVLAKTYRDEYIINLSKEYPKYDWDKNMGYPTKKHISVIQEIGLTKYHRKTYKIKYLENNTLF